MTENYGKNDMDEIVEKASDLCHEEWMDWTKTMAKELDEILNAFKLNNGYLNDSDEINKPMLIKRNTQLIEMIEDRLNRWESYWIPYDELSDDVKEYDRIYARKILDLVKD